MCVQIDLMKCSKLLLACNIQLKVFFVHNSHLENTDLHLNQECVRVQVLDMEVHLSKIRSEKKIECFDIIENEIRVVDESGAEITAKAFRKHAMGLKNRLGVALPANFNGAHD